MASRDEIGQNGNLSETIEDHALDSIPQDQRKSGWALAWSTAGVVTSLLNVLLGGFVAAVVGIRLAIIAGVLVAIFGVVVGWLVGHISYREGLSSTVVARFYGLGVRGSAIASAVYGAFLISALALENALLYNGTIFAFGWEATLANAVLIYAILTIIWILLTTFGINLVVRISSVLVIAFIALLIFMIWKAGFASSVPIGETLSYGPLLPDFGGTWSRFVVAIVTLVATAGALAFFDADYGRYARSTRDVGILATVGVVAFGIGMVATGAIIVYGSVPIVGEYLVSTGQATAANADQQARAFSDTNPGAYFIILSSIAGFILMYVAQAKVQVLNVYSGSLTLSNLFDAAAGWRPGRIAMILLSNLVALGLVAVGVLTALETLLGILGILLSSVIGLMIADYYMLRRRGVPASESSVEATNWAGIVTFLVACIVSITLQQLGIFPLGFLLALAIALTLYPGLRLSILKPGTMTRFMSVDQAMLEKGAEPESDSETT